MLKLTKILPAIAAAAMVAGISLPASADDVDSRTVFSGTAEPGYYYNEGQWMKSEVVPHVMRPTDTKTVIAGSPGAGYTLDEGGRYTKQVEVPHTMAKHPSGPQTSSVPLPGYFLDEGVYRKAQ